MRAKTVLIGAALAAGLILSGCGAGSDDSSKSSSGTGANGFAAGPAAAPDQAQRAAAEPDTGGTAPDQKTAPDLGVDQRSIIYRGSLSVRVDNVNAAAGSATGIATTAGGFVGSDQRTTGGNGKDTATIELRVPAPKFNGVVDELAKLGVEQQRQFSTEDVTEQVVDLDARIQVQQARVDSGRKLLAQAKTLADLVMLEKEVATRESDLASLQAKKRKLADLTALSTITVTFFEKDAPPPAQKTEHRNGFVTGLDAGWHALLASLKVVLTILGALLPWALIIGIPAWLLYRLFRRYRTTHPARPARRPATAAGPLLPGWHPMSQPTPPPPAQPTPPAKAEQRGEVTPPAKAEAEKGEPEAESDE